MIRFPTAGHLVSWAKFAHRARQCAGKAKPGTTGKGSPWLGGTPGEAGIGAARTKTFLGSRYQRIARRRGKQRALVAVGNSLLVIAYHLHL
jgi:transposase